MRIVCTYVVASQPPPPFIIAFARTYNLVVLSSSIENIVSAVASNRVARLSRTTGNEGVCVEIDD